MHEALTGTELPVPLIPSNKLSHRTTKYTTCAPSEDSAQPWHPPSLIRVFTARLKKPWILGYPLRANEDADQTGWIPRLICVFAVRTCHFVGFVMLRLNCFVPLLPKIKIAISYVPCTSTLPLCPISPIFRPLFPSSPEINAFVPLFPKTPERAQTYFNDQLGKAYSAKYKELYGV